MASPAGLRTDTEDVRGALRLKRRGMQEKGRQGERGRRICVCVCGGGLRKWRDRHVEGLEMEMSGEVKGICGAA